MNWVRNIASNYLRFGTGLLVMAVMTPVIIDAIGVTAYGQWAIVFAAIGLVSLSDLGFATAAIKFLAEAGSDRGRALQEITGSLLAVYAGLTGLCGLLIGGLYLADAMPLPQVFLLLGISTILIMATSVHRAYLVAAGRQEVVNWTIIAGSLVQAGLTWTLLNAGMGVQGMALAHLASHAVQSLAIVLLAGHFDFPRPRFSGVSQQLARISRFSIWALLANVSFMLILRVDPLLIEQLLDAEAVALFAIALKVGEQLLLFNKQFSNALLPLISRTQAPDDWGSRADLLIFSTRYLLVFAAPIALLLAVQSGELLTLWIGESILDAALPLSVLALAALVSTIQFNAANLVGMSGHPAWVAGSMMLSAGVKILLGCLLLVQVGIVGAALATLVSAVVCEVLINVTKACRIAGIGWRRFISVSVAPGLLCALPAGLLASVDSPVTSLWMLLLVSAGYGLVSLVLFWLVFCNETDSQFFKRFLFQRESSSCVPSIAN